jgi:DNA polymerase/3'-5' exonuclease PolX
MELTEAKKIADRVCKSAKKACSRAEVAGSIRREKQNVKDVELVLVVEDYQKLFKCLSKHGRFIKPGVAEVIDWPPQEGAKYLRMMLNEGVKCDVFIATEENWGGIFCMRTGSGVGPDGSPFSGFIPAMFKRWKKVSKGGKMTGGQPTLPDGTVLPVLEEKDMFELCQVEWVEPKDRVDCKALRPL